MLLTALVVAVVVLMIPFLVRQFSIPLGVAITRSGLPVIGAVVGAALGLVLGAHSGLRVIDIRDGAVSIREGLRRPRSWRLDQARFTAQVTRNRTNGVPSGTDRSLVVTSPEGTRTISMPGFSAGTFDEILHNLGYGNPASEQAAAVAEAASAERMFTPLVVEPPRPARLGGARLVSVIALGVVAVATLTGAVLVPEVEGLIVMGVLGLVLGGLALAVAFTGRARSGRVPQRIEVSPTFLSVDGWTAQIAELDRVELLPPNFTGAPRELIAVRRDGSRMSWSLGAAPASEGAADPFPDYPRLVDAIATVRPAEPLLRLRFR